MFERVQLKGKVNYPSLFHHSLIKVIILHQLKEKNITWDTFIEVALKLIQQNLGFFPKTWAFAPKLTLGDPITIVPQHKDRDSPLSHSARAEILLQRSPNSTWEIATSVVLCVATCLIYSIGCLVVGLALSFMILFYILCKFANFS